MSGLFVLGLPQLTLPFPKNNKRFVSQLPLRQIGALTQATDNTTLVMLLSRQAAVNGTEVD
jgi:hypothetical protein